MSWGATDTADEVFAVRLGSRLRTTRQDRGASLRDMARATAGAATGRQLRAIEAAEADLARFDVAAIAAAYGLELSCLLGERVPVEVELATGTVRSGGSARRFPAGDPDGLLLAYLLLVRELRDLPKGSAVAIRRDDVEVLAHHLAADPAAVVDRLATLMGAGGSERHSIAALFAAGAAVLVLTTSGIVTPASYPADRGDPDPDPARRPGVEPLSPPVPPPPPLTRASRAS